MNQPRSIKQVAVLFNPDKPDAEAAVKSVLEFAASHGVKTSALTHMNLGGDQAAYDEAFQSAVNHSDALIVLGGDGTLLGIARQLAETPKPVLGINLGTFGFLSASNVHDLKPALTHLFEGNFHVINRYLLETRVVRNGDQKSREIFRSFALNEALITLSQPGRLLNLWLEENDKPSLAYRCDGLIVATPTGSTGHSLSAGGPILEPHLAALVVTPVSPHSLFNRPWVVGGESELCIRFQEEPDPKVLILDGQLQVMLESTDRVLIRRSSCTVPTVTFSEQTFINVLRYKFNLGGQA